MTKTALFFGSFNPIHRGHIEIAKTILNRGYAEELWLVVSPQNPLKENIERDGEWRADETEKELQRLNLNDKIKVCRIEFAMPIPSYTIDTLEKLRTQYPDRSFCLVMGEDNLRAFHRWKSYRQIAETTEILVYPRTGGDYTGDLAIDDSVKKLPNIQIIDAGLLEISSSQIRASQKQLEEGILCQQQGAMDKALNHFIEAVELNPENTEAQDRMKFIRSIFEYAYKGHYNP